jgi:hypothetical protein
MLEKAGVEVKAGGMEGARGLEPARKAQAQTAVIAAMSVPVPVPPATVQDATITGALSPRADRNCRRSFRNPFSCRPVRCTTKNSQHQDRDGERRPVPGRVH